MNESDWPRLRRMAREIGVSPAALRDAVECAGRHENQNAAADEPLIELDDIWEDLQALVSTPLDVAGA